MSESMFINTDNRFDGSNLVIFDSTPYRIENTIPMKMRYKAVLILSVVDGVAIKHKDSFGSVGRFFPSDYTMLYALENKLPPELKRLSVPKQESVSAVGTVVFGTNNTLKVMHSEYTLSSLRFYQTEQFGGPSNAKIIELRAADELIEKELGEADLRISQLEAELKALKRLRDATYESYTKALAQTREAERLADHIDVHSDPTDYSSKVKSEIKLASELKP